ncbi:uncharacterized protein [Henckelia pumila]|uniref:uncharacterized protein n=1 Tax=Henckelia pumila TaxID=405737 RepID=UPI003C6DD10F
MLLSTLKPVTYRIPPAIGENGSHPNASKVALVNTQTLPPVKVQIKSMKEREQPLLQESSTVFSRREMMPLTAVSLCFASLFFPATADARPRNATMRQKIMEKFDELKQKAGLSKPKDEGKGNELDELKQKAGLSKPKDEGKGNEPKDNVAKKSKPTNETYGSKAKSKDDVAGTNPRDASQQTPVHAPEKEPSVSTLPTLPPLNFLTGRTVETSVS